jgi:hypothetical protein
MVTTLGDQRPFASDIQHLAEVLHGVDSEMCGTAGLRCLLDQPLLAKEIGELSADTGYQIAAVKAAIEHPTTPTDDLERLNAALVSLKDSWWAIDHDRLHFAAGAAGLAGSSHNAAAVRTWSVSSAL